MQWITTNAYKYELFSCFYMFWEMNQVLYTDNTDMTSYESNGIVL